MRPGSLSHSNFWYWSRLLILSLILVVICSTPLLAQTSAQQNTNADAALQRLRQETGGEPQISRSRATELVNFLVLPAASSDVSAAGIQRSDEVLVADAQQFFNTYGAIFGVSDASGELSMAEIRTDLTGGKHVIFQQTYQGLAVLGGQLRVHYNANGQVTAANGDFVPAITVNPQPTLALAQATQRAQSAVLLKHLAENRSINLSVAQSRLIIYRTGLVQGTSGQSHLAYEIEVATPNLSIREVVYVDAHAGKVLDQFSLVHDIDRRVYNDDFGPEFLVWSEGDTRPYTGTNATSVNNLIDFAEDTYNIFATISNGDYRSFDGNEATMHSVSLPNDPFFCPNAQWTGLFTRYCPGVDGDDTVGHEWGHAYTEYTDNLIYAWQPGALNESYSDIAGEMMDMLNGVGLDTGKDTLRTENSCSIYSGDPTGEDSYRWLSGEDDPAFGGAIRDMWNPTCYDHPGKVSDEQYWCTRGDSGGVHINSGVSNHAFALMVDGGTYNGQVIQGIGMTKTAHIYWAAKTNYQTPVTQFAGHADALLAACTDLASAGAVLPGISTESPVPFSSGQTITTTDCAEVAKVIEAVELRKEPIQCNFTALLDPNAPPLCQDAGTIQTISLTDWESGPAGWTIGSRDIVSPATFSHNDWVITNTLPAERTGSAMFAEDRFDYGDCFSDLEASVRFLESPLITLPASAHAPRIAVDHLVATEYSWDGGNIKISINGGPWQLIPTAAFEFNPYNDPLILAPFSDNPMQGEPAFTGDNPNFIPINWGQSQINLSGLAKPGDTIQLRIEIGIDSCFGFEGWYVDDVRLYSCSAETEPTTDEVIYVSTRSNGKAGSLRFRDEDIVAYNTRTAEWSIYFDGSNVGLGQNDVDAFEILPDGAIVFSLLDPITLAGAPVDDADLLLFTPTSTGHNQTTGTLEVYFPLSLFGLTSAGEDVDAIGFTPGGYPLISTKGTFSNPVSLGDPSSDPLQGKDEDIFLLDFLYTGFWLPYFDGSDIGLTDGDEDIAALYVDPSTNEVHIGTGEEFSVSGNVEGEEHDLFGCSPTVLGLDTACTNRIVWDGESHALRGSGIDGYAILWQPRETALNAATNSGINQGDEADELEADSDADDLDDGTAQNEASSGQKIYLPAINRQ